MMTGMTRSVPELQDPARQVDGCPLWRLNDAIRRNGFQAAVLTHSHLVTVDL